MNDVRDRLTDFLRALPVAQRITVGAVLAALLMGIVLFGRWVTTPTYTVLYSGLDADRVSGVIDQLETLGVPYQLEAAGSTVMVPRERLYQTRAQLASEGITGRTVPQGYELLDQGGLSVSDFRQRIDYQRALEGELSKTLMAMDGVASATVHLVVPEQALFEQEQQPVTASVLVNPRRQLDAAEVETITFLVASSVEGLEIDRITVADAKGTVLHAPGEAGGASVATNRNLRQTQEYERALAADITRLLDAVTGSPASVVVRATLNFDEREESRETYDPDSAVELKSQQSTENYTGTGAGTPVAGAVGVDGGPLEVVEGAQTDYQRDEVLTEYGVDKTLARTVAAPGAVEKLSVAIAMDDGSITGRAVPPAPEIERLVAAALGIEPGRGDSIAVSRIPFPAAIEVPEEDAGADMVGIATQAIAVLVLFIVSLGLFLMTRRRRSGEPTIHWEEPLELPDPDGALASEPAREPAKAPAVGTGSELHREVTDLVQHQPEEIAALLRSWLADRRG